MSSLRILRRAALPVLLVLPLLAACTLNGTTQPVQIIPTAVVPTAIPQEEEETAPVEEEVAAVPEFEVPENSVQATLIPEEGRVEVRRSWQLTFNALQPNQAVFVTTGDIIRTDSDGFASLVYEDNTETLLYPDTVVALDLFVSEDDGSNNIQLMQYIGTTFNRINFADSASRLEHMTPYGVAEIVGTGYWVVVGVEGPNGATILTHELEDFEGEIDVALSQGNFGALLHAVLALFGTTPGFAEICVSSGTVQFTDSLGNTVFIRVGNCGSTATNANGSIDPTTIEADNPFCGDGICDPYYGETALSCTADC